MSIPWTTTLKIKSNKAKSGKQTKKQVEKGGKGKIKIKGDKGPSNNGGVQLTFKGGENSNGKTTKQSQMKKGKDKGGKKKKDAEKKDEDEGFKCGMCDLNGFTMAELEKHRKSDHYRLTA